MAHLLTVRISQSMTQGKGLIYGVDELEEFEISKRKYPVINFREGYNKPFASTWTCRDYRIKKENLGKLCKDLNGINLNPSPNKMTLFKLFGVGRNNRTATIGKFEGVIQLLFKWINKKWLSSFLLLLMYACGYACGIHLIGLIPTLIMVAGLFLNPIKPIPVDEDYVAKPFTKHWKYVYCYGSLRDIEEPYGLNSEYKEEDVL